MKNAIIVGKETKMNKFLTFPRPEWGFIHAIEQENYDEVFLFLKADLIDWGRRIRKWWPK